MTTPSVDPADDAMLARLRRVAQAVDPAPPLVYEMGHAAFALRRLDAELAQLVADSSFEAAGVRGTGESRLLSFEAGELAVEVQVTPAGHRRGVIGQVVPPPANGIVRLESHGGDTVTAELDGVGGFRFDDVGGGRVRFSIELPDAPPVVTTWVSL